MLLINQKITRKPLNKGERLLQIVAALTHCTTASFSILEGTTTWHLHTKLYKFGYIVFLNISYMKYRTDLIFEIIFYDVWIKSQ